MTTGRLYIFSACVLVILMTLAVAIVSENHPYHSCEGFPPAKQYDGELSPGSGA